MTDNALSWLEKMLTEQGVIRQRREKEALEAEQREASRILRKRRAVLKPFAPPFTDYRRETDYQWHTCRMRRATVTWIP